MKRDTQLLQKNRTYSSILLRNFNTCDETFAVIALFLQHNASCIFSFFTLQGGYAMPGVCLSVCLSVCLFVYLLATLRKKLLDGSPRKFYHKCICVRKKDCLHFRSHPPADTDPGIF